MFLFTTFFWLLKMHPETLNLFLSSWQAENLALIPGYKMQPQQRGLLTMKFETDSEGKETNKTYWQWYK